MNVQARALISATELYVIMARELKRRQSQRCKACFLELPYRMEDRGAQAANWAIDLPPDCGDDCRGIIEDLYAEFSVRYNVI